MSETSRRTTPSFLKIVRFVTLTVFSGVFLLLALQRVMVGELLPAGTWLATAVCFALFGAQQWLVDTRPGFATSPRNRALLTAVAVATFLALTLGTFWLVF